MTTLSKTKGIVLRASGFGETSLVVQMFTRDFGVQSYIVNSVRVDGAKNRMGFFQPMTLLEVVVYHKEKEGVKRMKSFGLLPVHQLSTQSTVKGMIGVFIADVLKRTIHDGEAYPELFDWIVLLLEDLIATSSTKEFHLLFLIRYCDFLGVGPFSVDELDHANILSATTRASLDGFMKVSTPGKDWFSPRERTNILNLLLDFYTRHLEVKNFRSLEVLRQLAA